MAIVVRQSCNKINLERNGSGILFIYSIQHETLEMHQLIIQSANISVEIQYNCRIKISVVFQNINQLIIISSSDYEHKIAGVSAPRRERVPC